MAVLWPQGWVYWPNNGHCSPCHTKLLSVTRRLQPAVVRRRVLGLLGLLLPTRVALPQCCFPSLLLHLKEHTPSLRLLGYLCAVQQE